MEVGVTGHIFEDVYFTKSSFHITLKKAKKLEFKTSKLIKSLKKFHHQRKQVSTCIILVLKEVKFLAFLALQRNYFMYVLPKRLSTAMNFILTEKIMDKISRIFWHFFFLLIFYFLL
jgi:hypothetical protein